MSEEKERIERIVDSIHHLDLDVLYDFAKGFIHNHNFFKTRDLALAFLKDKYDYSINYRSKGTISSNPAFRTIRSKLSNVINRLKEECLIKKYSPKRTSNARMTYQVIKNV